MILTTLGLLTLMLLSGRTEAAFSANTDSFLSTVSTCSTKSNADRSCLSPVKSGLQKLVTGIQVIEAVRERMEAIADGMDAIEAVSSLTKYVPKIGTAISILQNTLKVAQVPFNNALDRVKSIDKKINPYKTPASTAKNAAVATDAWLVISKTACDAGSSAVTSAKSCISNMAAGSQRSTLEGKLESLGGSLNPGFSDLNSALGHIGTVCSTLKSVTDITINWPDISGIKAALDSVYNALKPILDFFDEIRKALQERLCIPDPIEALREWELLEEVKEAFNPGNWFGRRRRSIAGPKTATEKRSLERVTREEASAVLVRYKRGNLACFSVQDILDGIDKVFGALVDLANQAIAKVLSVLPSFTIPGFPDFSKIFDINFNFNFPSIDFGIDLNLWNPLKLLNWDCAIEVKGVCDAGTGSVSASCSKSLSDFVSGRKKRMVTEPSEGVTSMSKINDNTWLVELDFSVIPHNRSDDKQLSEDEARSRASHFTPAQIARVGERLRQRAAARAGRPAGRPAAAE